MAKGELLLEIRCEEIPARMLSAGIRGLATRLFEELMGTSLGPREVETGITPRRLVVFLKGIPEREPERDEELQGPPASAAYDAEGKPTRAAEGFAKRCGVEVEALRRVETEKGEYVVAVQHHEGRSAREVLAELIPRLILEIPWPKTMRWGEGSGPFVRPVHGVVALFEGEVVPFELLGVASGDTTVGHPRLSPEPFRVRGSADYRRKLSRRGIEVRVDRRREVLAEGMAKAAEELGGSLVEDDELLDRLAAICEVPGIVEGRFEPELLGLPREVLTTSLRDHQSALAVESDGELLPAFLTVMDRPDDPAGRVRAGNEWVVAARLEDARFFWQEDRKVALAERVDQLQNLTFHAALGSYAEKAGRIRDLADEICERLGWEVEREAAREAGLLLKADLTTEMVKEFTSLQGVMGGVYAREEGYPEAIWRAIYDQYRPTSVEDPVPNGRVGMAVAVADRIDTMVGFFGRGMKPKGSKDPFGLRRAAQGVVRILLEGGLDLDIDLVAARAARLYGERLRAEAGEVLSDLRPFFDDRVRYILGRRGFAFDEIEAGLAVGAADLPDLAARVEALHDARHESAFLSVVLAAKRILNILKGSPEYEFHAERLVEPAEKDLYDGARRLKSEVEAAEGVKDYRSSLKHIGEFAEILDRFFVEVLVMDENRDLKENRIALLQLIHRTPSRTARLTEMVVDRAEHRARSEGPETEG